MLVNFVSTYLNSSDDVVISIFNQNVINYVWLMKYWEGKQIIKSEWIRNLFKYLSLIYLSYYNIDNNLKLLSMYLYENIFIEERVKRLYQNSWYYHFVPFKNSSNPHNPIITHLSWRRFLISHHSSIFIKWIIKYNLGPERVFSGITACNIHKYTRPDQQKLKKAQKY